MGPSSSSTSTRRRPARSVFRSSTSTIRSARRCGGTYVNDFVDRGRIKKVYVQADAPFRTTPERLAISGCAARPGRWRPSPPSSTPNGPTGPRKLERYNGLPSFEIKGSPAPGDSSGTAMAAMEEHARKLPPGIGFEWTGLSYEEQLSGGQAPALYALSLLIVFLCLAALYESWSVPIAVLLVVPLGVVGAVLAARLTGLNNDIYLQVGLITTIGVSAKNAILIVEFAEERMRDGLNAVDAALEAAKLRLRPILMTSLRLHLRRAAAGAVDRRGRGRPERHRPGVVGGMLSATVLAIFFVPVFFTVVKRCSGRTNRHGR